jgi:plastocyanin
MCAWGLSAYTSPKAEAKAHAVAIASFNYQPADVRIAVGDTVEWRNLDPTVHTVTASRGEFSSGSMRQGQTFRATFNAPGVYPYFCEPHETMRGMVSVTGTAAPTTTTTATTSTTVVTGAPTAPGSVPVTGPAHTTTTVPDHNGAAAPVATTAAPVVASAVMGEADQASPILPIAAVIAVTATLLAALRRAEVLRYLAVAATLATGLLHLQVRFALDYPEPIGTLLVIEAAGAAVVAAWLVAAPFTRTKQLVAIGAHAAALGALAITRTSIGLFGFHEIGWDPSPQLPVAVALGLVAVGLLSAARPSR